MKTTLRVFAVVIAICAMAQAVQRAANASGATERSIDANQITLESYLRYMKEGRASDPNFKLDPKSKSEFLNALREYVKQNGLAPNGDQGRIGGEVFAGDSESPGI